MPVSWASVGRGFDSPRLHLRKLTKIILETGVNVLTVLDLFCGAGGLSHGFKMADFDIIAGIDNWNSAILTFRENHKDSQAILTDIRQTSDNDIKNLFSGVDVVIGGPPCQAFSTAGKRSLDDERAKLVKEYLRVISVLKPSVFLFENVKGFISFDKGKLLKELLNEFENLGYYIDYKVLNAVNFSVPQNRERFFILGFKTSLKIKPNLPTENLVFGKTFSFIEAVSDLPMATIYPNIPLSYKTKPKNKLQEYYRQEENTEALKYHTYNKYSPKLTEMIVYIPQGKSAHEVDLPSSLKPSSGFKNTYKRIVANQPAPTITRNFSVPSSQNCIHPFENRALTVLEAMRLQSFPDNYKFVGSQTDIRLLIGNAVPPLLAFGIGIYIYSYFNDKFFNKSIEKYYALL